MKDPIERQAAIDTVESFDILDGYTDQQELICRIRQLPSAQPEIIRCKNCKHKNLVAWACQYGLPCSENFFCAYGERKGKIL